MNIAELPAVVRIPAPQYRKIMRYRKLDSNGDYTFGSGLADFFVDTPECVAQAVLTRLLLLRGEWFVDITDGTPYATEILGKSNKITYDRAIRDRILGTPNVQEITEYFSSVVDRALSVQATITTAFGIATVEATL